MNERSASDPMNTPQLPTPETITMQLDEIIAGLVFCEKRVSADDVFRSRMGRLAEDVRVTAREIELFINAERTEYDALISILEARDQEIAQLYLRVNELEESKKAFNEKAEYAIQETQKIVENERNRAQDVIDKVEHALAKTKGELDISRSNFISATAENVSLRLELKNLKALEPVKMQKKLAEQKKKNGEITRTKNDLQASLNKLQLDHINTKKAYSDISAKHTVLIAEMDSIRDRMNMLDGEHILRNIRFTSLNSSEMIFYPYVFHFGLEITEGTERQYGENFVSGLDFHIQVRTTLGLDTTVKLNEWGVVYYHLVEELREHWPDELDDFLQEFYFEQLESLNPLLHKRCVWANAFNIMDIEALSAKIRQSLCEHGYHTLAQLGSASVSALSEIKGIGEKTAGQIKLITSGLLIEWNIEHGKPNLREHGEKREHPAIRIRKAQQENRLKN
ncbi:helix-hairpin-helix domain-containing protein [Xenorhabdus bovienii]|uniref:helix-hairpin-helix domain-containing protein n=1 Tax=Xenorhabdus bovienii TaxID=40576 RepID=UPI003DA26269